MSSVVESIVFTCSNKSKILSKLSIKCCCFYVCRILPINLTKEELEERGIECPKDYEMPKFDRSVGIQQNEAFLIFLILSVEVKVTNIILSITFRTFYVCNLIVLRL